MYFIFCFWSDEIFNVFNLTWWEGLGIRQHNWTGENFVRTSTSGLHHIYFRLHTAIFSPPLSLTIDKVLTCPVTLLDSETLVKHVSFSEWLRETREWNFMLHIMLISPSLNVSSACEKKPAWSENRIGVGWTSAERDWSVEPPTEVSIDLFSSGRRLSTANAQPVTRANCW